MTTREPWMRVALEAGTITAALWRAIRDEAGAITDLQVLECSSGFQRWFGRDGEDLRGCRYSELLPSGVRDRLPMYAHAIETGEAGIAQFEPVSRPGRALSTEMRFLPCGEDLLYAQMFDVTERELRFVASERALAAAETLRDMFESVLDAVPESIVLYRVRPDRGTAHVTVVYANQRAADGTERSARAMRGLRLADVDAGAEGSGLAEAIRSAAANHSSLQRTVVPSDAPSREVRVTSLGADLVLCTSYAVHQAATPSADFAVDEPRDALTGVLTRSAFIGRLDLMLQTARRGGVLLVDIDDFGAVNDMIGQHAADAFLAELATALTALTPRAASVGRSGPDEFALHVLDIASERDAERYFLNVASVASELARTYMVPRLHVTGGFAFTADGGDARGVLRDADTAMRSAVMRGGGRLAIYTATLREDSVRRARLGDDIVRGLNDSEFVLAYQPIVHLDDSRMWGAEALVRWKHRDMGMLPPSNFIAAAEASGLIVELGAWVLETLVAHLAVTPQLQHASCNVSSRQVTQDDIPFMVGNALEQYGVAPQRLCVEITESALLPDSGRVRSQLRDLRAMGVSVALDDFGSGYSSIAYLDRLSFDLVKLDGYFVGGELSARRRSLVASTARMVHALGAQSVIEHIETREQLDLAAEAGVQLGQGHLFGPPAAA